MSLDPLVARVLVSRYGMDGRGARSLEHVARELGLSREELRLLEAEIVLTLRTLARGPLTRAASPSRT